jgi:predicted NAD-dependent protein-ADP-ribosyltransferase YbiA (DUF1768 family)
MEVFAFTESTKGYEWLSPENQKNVWFERKCYPTAEHLFQCLRFAQVPDVIKPSPDGVTRFLTANDIVRKILEQKTPEDARRKVNDDYFKYYKDVVTEAGDIQIMRTVVRLKVSNDSYYFEKLMGICGEIIFDSTGRPGGNGQFWGAKLVDGVWVGKNHLGLIWAGLRDEFREVLST